MKHPAATLLLLIVGATAGPGLVAGCGRADEPTQFTPATSTAADPPPPPGRAERRPAGERSSFRKIEMH